MVCAKCGGCQDCHAGLNSDEVCQEVLHAERAVMRHSRKPPAWS